MSLMKMKKNHDLIPGLLSDFFDSDRLFGRNWLDRSAEWTLPAVNIKETETAFDLDFAAPGFTKDDFKIDLSDAVLTISAEKQQENKEENDRFTRREFSFNSFSRSFNLPQNINEDKIEASYTDGILRVHVAKKEATQLLPKKEIKVS